MVMADIIKPLMLCGGTMAPALVPFVAWNFIIGVVVLIVFVVLVRFVIAIRVR